jgi:phosphohistidine swiveling domain-containing protein
VELDTRYIRRLDGVGAADTAAVGRKAAFLGELMAAGQPVPPGYVLTVEAQPAAEEEPSAAVLVVLDALAAELGDTPVAVRSSGTSEDLAGSSFAGQYDTVLDVRGRAALEAAVRQCWASARSEHVLAYQRANGIEQPTPMAVVVQRMVPAVAAGVAFSANPVTGARDEVVVNAVRGLAERLVSGQAAPDEWVVRAGVATRTAGHEDALDAARVVEIAAVADALEEHFGAPQDIEWAFDGETVWLVQARPITTLAAGAEPLVPIAVEVPPGTWTRDAFTRRPWKNLQVSIFQPVLNQATEGIAEFGVADGMEYRQIGGWTYSRLRTLAPEQVGPRLAVVAAARERDEQGRTIERWHEEWRAAFGERLAALRADVDTTDAGLARRTAALDAFVAELFAVHFRIGAAGLYLVGEFGLFCHDELGWPLARSVAALAGLPGMTTEPTFALGAVAGLVRTRAGLAERLAELPVGPGFDVAGALKELDPEVAQLVDGYLDDYCRRVMGIDISEPTLAEQPWTVLRLLVDQVASGLDPQAEAAESARRRLAVVEEARSALRERADPQLVERFEHLLHRAERAQQTRDDKAFLVASARGAVRALALDHGARLVLQGVLEQVEDVFHLERAELAPALRGEFVPTDLAERRGRYAWAVAHPGPRRYGEQPAAPAAQSTTEGPPAWLQQLPPPMRHVMTVLLWIYGNANATEATGRDADLVGVAGAPGRYTGPVRVILGEDGFDRLRQGDVLVCPETTPQWSVLFPKVGALVTDSGGLLSHPAIIAREFRIPAVIATGVGTAQLRDGQIVTVDGDAGTVDVVQA